MMRPRCSRPGLKEAEAAMKLRLCETSLTIGVKTETSLAPVSSTAALANA